MASKTYHIELSTWQVNALQAALFQCDKERVINAAGPCAAVGMTTGNPQEELDAMYSMLDVDSLDPAPIMNSFVS